MMWPLHFSDWGAWPPIFWLTWSTVKDTPVDMLTVYINNMMKKSAPNLILHFQKSSNFSLCRASGLVKIGTCAPFWASKIWPPPIWKSFCRLCLLARMNYGCQIPYSSSFRTWSLNWNTIWRIGASRLH